MNSLLNDSLYTKLFAPIVLIFGAIIIVMMVYIPSITKENAIKSAIPSAESTVKQYKAIRGYYTKKVVKKVLATSNIKPHFNHEGQAGRIPLPATFIHDISKEFSSKGIMELKLYSAFPFPNRDQRQLDSFGLEAWKELNLNPKQTFSRTDEINGKQVVRVAVADTMSADGCVNCHNNHPDTPKSDWKLNDVRGVLEVQIPIDNLIIAGRNLSTKIITLMTFALIITIGVLFFLFRRLISRRLVDISNAMQDIADGDGDLSQRLTSSSKDELGGITTSFNNFVEKLEGSLKQIATQTHQLVDTAQGLISTTEQSQQEILRQQQETDQVATAMNEMTATVQEVANLAANTASSAESTNQETEHGRKIVTDNMQSVEKLSREMAEAAEVVANLEDDSQNIGSVLDVIRGIAEQTNLLALNAAIEAARAGEQGRGFAVVADEVRTLASRTQSSTEEIQQMIEQLQQRTKVAVSSITKGNESLQTSLEHANDTNDVIGSIADSTTNIYNLNIQIATAAEEQTAVSKEINRNINNIADVAIKSTESSAQLLNSAEEINHVVSAINKQLKQFTSCD